MHSPEIRVARSLAELEPLREAWQAWGGHRDSDIDMVLTIIDSYPESKRPHVVALYKDGKPDAILIGRLDERVFNFKVGYLSVLRSKARCLTFVYGAIRGNNSRENTEILISEVMKSLKADEADMALVEFVPLDSPLYELSLKFPGFLSRDTRPQLQGHDLMQVPPSIDEVFARMSGTRRKHLRSADRKLQSHPDGALRIECYRQPAELDRLFSDAESIATKTYQRGLGAGFSDSEIVRRRLGLAAEKGWLRAYLLYLGEKPVAFWIGMLYHGTFVSEYMGYDPEYRNASPGMVLIMRTIAGFCGAAAGDEVRELDFGLGHAEYKALLSTKSWSEAAIFIFSPTPKGLFLKTARVVTRSVDAFARKLLSSTKVFDKFKRIWRDRLAKQAASAGSQGSSNEAMAPSDCK